MVSGETPERIIPDLLNMEHEYLFKLLAREGDFPLELKCFFLVLVLIVPCLVVNFVVPFFASDYLSAIESLSTYFSQGWLHFIATLFMGAFAYILIRFLRDIDKRFQYISRVIFSPNIDHQSEGKKQGYWNTKIAQYAEWTKSLVSHRWYYLFAVAGAVFGLAVGFGIIVLRSHGWIGDDLFKASYGMAWYVFYGFFAGACLFYVGSGFSAIREYCSTVVSRSDILPLDPDHTGGLRELGRLSLDLDLIVAVPSVLFPLFLLRSKIFQLMGLEAMAVGAQELGIAIFLALMYALLLALTFFGSISPAHANMLEAKREYLSKMHSEYRDLHKGLLRKLDSEGRIESKEYQRLFGLYDLYDKIEKMAVWPLDFQTTVRFSLTSVLPLLSLGLTVQIGI